MSLPLYIHGCTDVGRERQQNEDCLRVEALPDGSRLLLVCDGMGGHEAGEVASAVASQRIAELIAGSSALEPPRALYTAFTEANRAVADTALARGSSGMGTTAVAAWLLGTRVFVGWVGDSRLYHFREGALLDRTVDHTRVQQMIQRGILSPREARKHPDAHVLVQALGGSAESQRNFRPEVWNEPLELKQGDVLLLCSDGLYDFIEDSELYPLMERRDYQEAAERLVQTANSRGGADNITVILLVAGQPQVPPAAAAPPQPVRRQTVPEQPALVPPPPAAEPAAPLAPVPPSAAVPLTAGPRYVDPHPSPLPEGEGTSTGSTRSSPAVSAPVALAPEARPRGFPMSWVVGAAAAGLLVGALVGWTLAGGFSKDAATPASNVAPEGGAVTTAVPGSVSPPTPPVVEATDAGQAAAPAVQPAVAHTQAMPVPAVARGPSAPDAGGP
jgi:serine/threonine protein phosphatase PrpC